MKKVLIFVFCLLTRFSMAQCSCTNESISDENYLHHSGRTSAVVGSNVIPLTHGSEITPKSGSNVVFKFNYIPVLATSCVRDLFISIFDEKTQQYVHDNSLTNITDNFQFNYVFPYSDRIYTVRLTLSAHSTRKDIDPGLLANTNRGCAKQIAIIVKPTPGLCDCSTVLSVSGLITCTVNLFNGSTTCTGAIGLKSTANCNINLTSMSIGATTKPNLNIIVPFNNWGIVYNDTFAKNPKISNSLSNAKINFTANGVACSGIFPITVKDK